MRLARLAQSVTAAIAVAALLTVVPLPADALQSAVAIPPQASTDCAGDAPIIAASDAAAQSDLYSAVTLAGVIGTDCIILAGHRHQPMPTDQQARLASADTGGYIVGGDAAVPTAKLAERTMTRLAGTDRWATARLVGREAAARAGIQPAPEEASAGAERSDTDCTGDTPIVAASDTAAQSDLYSAVTLAGVIGTDCIILAGHRDQPMPTDQRTRLAASTDGGYIVGGAAAVPAAKLAGRMMARLAGADRWETARLVGTEATNIAAGNPTVPTEQTDAAATDVERCRPRGVERFTAGFPLPSGASPSTGKLRIGVLFMDFSDAQAAYTTEEETERGQLEWAETYLSTVSYGKLRVEFVPLHRWLRADQPLSAYYDEHQGLGRSTPTLMARSVALADDHVDFSTLDMVMTVLPSNQFIAAGSAGGQITADGATVRTLLINTQRRGEFLSQGYFRWGYTVPHEMVHNMGLLDLYPYDASAHQPPEAATGHEWVVTQWGLMRLEARYLAPTDDPRREQKYLFPDGRTSETAARLIDSPEMLSWSRWQLGWLDPSQVHCDDGRGTVELAPIAQPGDGIAMVVVPLDDQEVIVIESRRKLGYDLMGTHITVSNGATTTLPALITEGVLVYTVNTSLGSGQLPAKVAGDSGNGQVDDFPVLEHGESVTVRGYTITVTEDNGDTHTVAIAKDG